MPKNTTFKSKSCQAFLELIESHPELHGIHELRTRTSGGHDFAQFHIWVAPTLTIVEAHRVMDEVEAVIHEHFPGTEVLIHPDPQGLAEPGQNLFAS